MDVRWRLTATVVTAVAIGSAACSSGRGHWTSSTGSVPTTNAVTPQSPPTTSALIGAPPQPIPIAATSVSCAAAVQSHDPNVLLAAYRAARIAGHGAEGCLTAKAAGAYAQRATDDDLLASPGPMCLYRCGHYKVEDIVLSGSPSSHEGSQTYASLEIRLRNMGGATQTSYSGPLNEYITIGPGVVGGSGIKAAQVITDANDV